MYDLKLKYGVANLRNSYHERDVNWLKCNTLVFDLRYRLEAIVIDV